MGDLNLLTNITNTIVVFIFFVRWQNNFEKISSKVCRYKISSYICSVIKNKETMTTKEQIQNELGQEIKNIKEHEGFLIFDCEDGIRRSNKLTKTGKHKKGSIRVW